MTSYNMFAYWSTPRGMCAQISVGRQAQSGVYGDSTKWTTFDFSQNLQTLQVSEVINTENRGSVISSPTKGSTIRFRNVTYEVNIVLSLYVMLGENVASLANAAPLLYEGWRYAIFGLFVNHNATWDIKRKAVWESTIKTPFPGTGAFIIYNGMIMTPESLGNYIYGYLGGAFGIPFETLIDGSVFAAFIGSMKTGSFNIRNELEDWQYIYLGYLFYCI